MLTYQKKISFLKVRENWFTYSFKLSDLFSLNIFFHVKNRNGRKIWGIPNVTHTVELSLEGDLETITTNFSNTIKRDLKKTEKDDIECSFTFDAERFVPFFNEFASIKKIPLTSKRRLDEMKDNLEMSFATLNGEILAAHTYLVDKELGIARLGNSASKRFDENYDNYLVGRANKLLTYKNIIYYKEKGYKVLDFGGYNTTDESLKGINDFKLSFGGKVIPCYNYSSLGYFVFRKIAQRLGVLGHG
jgi:hypothetical protein